VEAVFQRSGYEEPTFYERYPGAASAPLPPEYRPRKPQESVLSRVVRENLLTFLEQGIDNSADGEGYPNYVDNELRRVIACGSAELGFARVRCPDCGFERLLPFSCKCRGACSSCAGRRMSEEAAYLVDMVLPRSRYRQWTFTFPWRIRRLMARDYKVITDILNLVIRALYAYQRRMARKAGHRNSKCASVTFVQRFGGALNLNVHFHVLAPDAVFIPGDTEEDELQRVSLAVPEDEDILGILDKVVRRVSALVEKRFGLDEDLGFEPETDVLDGAIDEAMRNVPRLPWNDEDGGTSDAPPDAPPDGPDDASDGSNSCRTGKRSMRLEGFSLHANTAVAEDNRSGLEKICSYGMRPPLSQERLSLEADGRVRLDLKRPWPTADGATALIFEPVEFIRRLAAIIPPPFAHTIRYHGLFAPRARDRDLLPAAPVDSIRLEAWARAGILEPKQDSSPASKADEQPDSQSPEPAGAADPSGTQTVAASGPVASPQPSDGGPGQRPTPATPMAVPSTKLPPSAPQATTSPSSPLDQYVHSGKRKPLKWRDLLRRVFAVDCLACPRCCGTMTVIAYITEVAVVTKILTHLGLPSEPPQLSPARGPAQLELWDDSEATGPDGAGVASTQARGPPSRAGPEHLFEPDDPVVVDYDWGA